MFSKRKRKIEFLILVFMDTQVSEAREGHNISKVSEFRSFNRAVSTGLTLGNSCPWQPGSAMGVRAIIRREKKIKSGKLNISDYISNTLKSGRKPAFHWRSLTHKHTKHTHKQTSHMRPQTIF